VISTGSTHCAKLPSGMLQSPASRKKSEKLKMKLPLHFLSTLVLTEAVRFYFALKLLIE
jgi:hypothetical protein